MNPEIAIDAVFILGAGASMGYNFPLGDELRKDIIKACDLAIKQKNYEHDEKDFETRYLQNFYGIELLASFLNTLRKADNDTIDDFLETHSDKYGDITRDCIALTMLLREKDTDKSDLFPKDKKSIYKVLINSLYHKKEDINNKKIYFVTFNYDISLEAYIKNKLKPYFDLSDREEETLLNKIQIIHLHGKLATNDSKWELGREYGNFKLTNGLIRDCSKRIKIITEVKKFDKEFEVVQDLIFMAKNIFFLGFGYGSDNLNNLNFKEIIEAKKKQKFHRTDYLKVFGTTFNCTEQRVLELKDFFEPFTFEAYSGKIIPFLENNLVFRNL